MQSLNASSSVLPLDSESKPKVTGKLDVSKLTSSKRNRLAEYQLFSISDPEHAYKLARMDRTIRFFKWLTGVLSAAVPAAGAFLNWISAVIS